MKHTSEQVLSEFLDHELPNGEQQKVREHLNACTECSAKLAYLQTAHHAIRRIQPLQLSSGLARNIAIDIHARKEQDEEWSVVEKTAERVLAMIALIVILVLAVTSSIDTQSDQPEEVSAGLLQVYFQDSTMVRLVSAESLSNDDLLAAALSQQEGPQK